MLSLFLYVVFKVVFCMLLICFRLLSGSLSSLLIASSTPKIAPLKLPENDLSRLLNYYAHIEVLVTVLLVNCLSQKNEDYSKP